MQRIVREYSKETFNITGDVYINYSDDNINYYEEILADEEKKRCSYEVNLKNSKPVKQFIEKDKEVSIYTLMYFYFIAKNSAIPVVKINGIGELHYEFDLEIGKKMKFGIDPGKETCTLELDKSIFILRSNFVDPFDIKNKIINVFKVLDDRLYIIDYSFNEFYDLTYDYKNTITGILKGDTIKEYRNKITGNHVLMMVHKDGNITGVINDYYGEYISSHEDEKNTISNYFLPYTITTEGIVVPEKGNEFICTNTITESKASTIITNSIYEIDSSELYKFRP